MRREARARGRPARSSASAAARVAGRAERSSSPRDRRVARPPRCRAGGSRRRISRRNARQRSSAPGASSWSRSTGVSDSVTRPGRGVEHVEQRQVGGRDRLPQPLLAERPRPEALDVGHVRVQDDRERPPRLTAAARPGGRARDRGRREPQREVARGDRRREAVVERLGDAAARAWTASQPSALERELVGAQPARVEQPEQLDRAEVRARTARGTPAARYSRTCHGLPERSAPFGASVSTFGRRDVGDAVAGRSARGCARAPRRGPARARSSAGTRRSRRRRPQLDHGRARSAAFGAGVLQARVLERLGVGVDADDRGGASRASTRGAVALAAGQVDDAPAADPRRRSTRRRRGGAGTSSSPPGTSGQRALAGELQRRHAGRLVALQVELGHGGADLAADRRRRPRT